MRKLVAGEIIQTYDEAFEEWMYTKVEKIRDGFVSLRVVDPDSLLEGMTWEVKASQLKWREKQ